MSESPYDEESAAALRALSRAGWTVGETSFVGPEGTRAWVVSGRNGENLIRAEGSSHREVWRSALAQARSLGMPGPTVDRSSLVERHNPM
jgi:hypothetical protein